LGSINELFDRIHVQIRSLLEREEGQDLVEYGLLVPLASLAAVTGVRKVADAVNLLYSNISSTL